MELPNPPLPRAPDQVPSRKCAACGKSFHPNTKNHGTACLVSHHGGCCHYNDTPAKEQRRDD